jgi:predicted deacylase
MPRRTIRARAARAEAEAAPFEIAGAKVAPGERRTVDLSIARFYTHSELTMPVHVVHGRKPGPRLFISAAMHGDEINGVEIIRRLIRLPLLDRLHGVLIAVPIVNVHGFIAQSRYLPDRRDLNRSFPGSGHGSLASRLAHMFTREVVSRSTHGIDLHTGALHRSNLPQVRARLEDAETLRLAAAFHVPVLINAEVRAGSVREVATRLGIPVLVYEGGEALRFDEDSIRVGLRGVVGVMRELGMLPPARPKRPHHTGDSVIARSTTWLRAPSGGILRTLLPLGSHVRKGEVLGVVSDPFGEREITLEAPTHGIVIGCLNLPLVNEGDAVFHIARFGRLREAAARVAEFRSRQQELDPELVEEASAD